MSPAIVDTVKSFQGHLDPAIVGAGHKERRVGGAKVHAPDALVVCLVLVDGQACVHVPQGHAALVVAAQQVAPYIPAAAKYS